MTADPSRAALITGCSSGIGHATALRLRRGGFEVYATARRPESLADLTAAGITTFPLDVTDETSIARAASTRRPRARYPVGTLARGLFALQHWLPGRIRRLHPHPVPRTPAATVSRPGPRRLTY